jgi:hypothetical protein
MDAYLDGMATAGKTKARIPAYLATNTSGTPVNRPPPPQKPVSDYLALAGDVPEVLYCCLTLRSRGHS